MTQQTIAFVGTRRLAAGTRADTITAARAALHQGESAPILIFDARTSETIELDLRDRSAVVDAPPEAAPARGRPKLGVTAREVTLLPRHWDWLASRGGGISAALRRLVEDARRADAAADDLRQGRESLYRFVTVMAGDAPGYEEAIRALFAGDRAAFESRGGAWPDDVRAHVADLSDAAFGAGPPSLDCLPDERRDAVRRALASAFPGTTLQAIAPMAPGASGATVYLLTIGGADWVLRLDGPPDAHRDSPRQYACMAMAQAACVAPMLIHASVADRLSITRRIAARPADPPLTRAGLLVAVSRAVRRLHDGPLFPERGDYMTGLGSIVTAFAAGGVATEAVAADITALWTRLSNDYPRDVELVSSHNDLNPSNVVFEGDRPWIVDWEASAPADRYVDIAAAANWYAADEDEAEIVLAAYFDGQPSAEQRTRFALMRRINRLFYGVMLLNAAIAEGPGPLLTADDLARAPRISEIRPRMAAIAAAGGRRLFGAAFLRDALDPVGAIEA